MAKTSMKIKEARREELAAKDKYPKVRLHNRCSICGRPRGYYHSVFAAFILEKWRTKVCFPELPNPAGSA